jgi:hypothetical protein
MKKPVVPIVVFLAAALAVLFVVYRTNFTQSLDQGLKSALTQSFREKFIPLCQATTPNEKRVAICECAATQALKQLTVKQLSDPEFAKYYIKTSIMPACVEQEFFSKKIEATK